MKRIEDIQLNMIANKMFDSVEDPKIWRAGEDEADTPKESVDSEEDQDNNPNENE